MTIEPLQPIAPKARRDDTARVLLSALASGVWAALRRSVGGRRRPSWGFGLEVTVATYRGTWSVLPKIGVVRWRNVGESLSSVHTNGLKTRSLAASKSCPAPAGIWLDPPSASEGALLYFHGGGFAFGSLKTHGDLIGALARATGLRTLAVDYRLAPEHPAPAAADDALAAYRYLLTQGHAPERIVLAGDSAGGTLVLSTLLALRDAGEPLPLAGVALSPWVDLDCSGESFRRNAPYDFVAEEHCRMAALNYLQGADPTSPATSPLSADLSGLPPLLLQAGAAEVLVDQIRQFATRAGNAGVSVKLSVYEDMVHVWHLLRRVAPAGQAAIDEVGAFVNDLLKPAKNREH